jgi:flagellin-like protein
MNRRGVSPVVATVLILLITILSATLIAPFVINFVNSNLDESGSCFDVVGDLEFAETGFNCYTETSVAGVFNTGFSIKINDDSITGFRVALLASGSSDAVEISEGTDGISLDPVIRMLNTPTQPLVLPSNGGVRTYVVQNSQLNEIELFPLLEGNKKCDAADKISIVQCSNDDAIDLVGV